MKNKIAVLLVNLGSPDDTSVPAVRRYLREFLSDPRVIDLPRWKWHPILQAILLIRPSKTAHAYKSVWREDGSPLIAISRQQEKKLIQRFIHDEDKIEIKLAMRYGNPSIKSALDEIQGLGCDKLLVFPLYPQYSATTIATVMDKVCQGLKSVATIPELRFINGYYQEPGYIEALANSISTFWQETPKPEKLLFSYHGIPERYIKQGDIYYEHCLATTELTAAKLGLAKDDYMTTFQSRFGREEWIKPYTDHTLIKLAQDGVKRVHILSPAFSADCLETLEELEVENRDYFQQNGGQEYRYIPALNDSERHIDLLESIVRKHLAGW